MTYLQNALIRRRTKQAFTLSELAIVLGIIGVVLAAVWIAAGNVSENNKVALATQELQAINQSIINVYGINASFTGTLSSSATASIYGCGFSAPAVDEIPMMFNAGIIPQNMMNTTTSAINPWGQPFAIYLIPPKSYRISFYCVPNDACIKLLLQATNCPLNTVGCPINVFTQGASNEIDPSPTIGWGGLTPAAAQSNCRLNAAPGTGGANSVEFQYVF